MINKTLEELRKTYDIEFTRDDYSYVLEMKKKNHHMRYSVLVEIAFFEYFEEEEEILDSLNSYKPKDIIEIYEDLMENENFREFNTEEWTNEEGDWIDNKKVLMTFGVNNVVEYEPSYNMDEVDNIVEWLNILINEDKEALGYFAQGWIESMSDDLGNLNKIEFVRKES